jgi:formylglycine-generating enzyme required for sulfatase activity
MGRLRAKTGLMFDVPTQAQWEYACRAGTTTAFNSGKNLTNTTADDAMAEVGRYYYNQSDGKGGYTKGTTKVGSYLPNAWGLYDMHGNVEECCLDWYDAYPYYSSTTIYTDPVGPSGPDWMGTHIMRGGDYAATAVNCRSSAFGSSTPGGTNSNHGFRVICLP